MGKLRLVTWSRSPSLSVGVGVGLIAPVGAPGPGLLGPREGDTGLEVLDSRLWGPAMSLLEALSRWDPSPGHLCCYYLGKRLAAISYSPNVVNRETLNAKETRENKMRGWKRICYSLLRTRDQVPGSAWLQQVMGCSNKKRYNT